MRAARTPAPLTPAPFYSIGVISDTHGFFPNSVYEYFHGVDLILHAGDIGRDDVLIELGAIAPTRAVSGNVDGIPTRERPLTLQLETPAGRIAVTHGHLGHAPSHDYTKMLACFAQFAPQTLIYGHSHIAVLREECGVWVLNPGSAGHPRFGKPASIARIWLDQPDAAPRFEIIEL